MGDLVMMRCEARTLTLSTAGCARMFNKAQEQQRSAWDAPNPCATCAIGAGHAGVDVKPMARATAALRHICPRCQRPSDRLIRGNHCISCYNRHREVVTGEYRKGTRPALADILHTAVVVVAEGEQMGARALPAVASRVEAMVAIAKGAVAPMIFGPGRLEFVV